MEDEKTCKNCAILQKNGFCGLVTASDIEQCLSNHLMHWTSIQNPQYELNLEEIENK